MIPAKIIDIIIMPLMFTVVSWLPGTVSLTGDRAQGGDSKHWAYSTLVTV